MTDAKKRRHILLPYWTELGYDELKKDIDREFKVKRNKPEEIPRVPDLSGSIRRAEQLSDFQRAIYEAIPTLPIELVMLVFEVWMKRDTRGASCAYRDICSSTALSYQGRCYAVPNANTSVACGDFTAFDQMRFGVVSLRDGTAFDQETSSFKADVFARATSYLIDSGRKTSTLAFDDKEDELNVLEDRLSPWKGTKTDGTDVRMGRFVDMQLNGDHCGHVDRREKMAWVGRFLGNIMQHGTCYDPHPEDSKTRRYRLFHGDVVKDGGRILMRGVASNLEEGDLAEGTFDIDSGKPVGDFIAREVDPLTRQVSWRIGQQLRGRFCGKVLSVSTGAVTVSSVTCSPSESSHTVTPLYGKDADAVAGEMKERIRPLVACATCKKVFATLREYGREHTKNANAIPEFAKKEDSKKLDVIDLT